ncbi:MAG: M43 family zinc metalloprotease [Bacteroidota bacterium]
MRISTLLLLFFLSFSFYSPLLAQIECGSDIIENQIRAQRPDYDWQIYQTDRLLKEKILAERQLSGTRTDDTIVYTIPVIWHILHLNQGENISDSRVYIEMDNVNEAFRNIGYYDSTRGADVRIQFCMAQVDPNGFPTNGIERFVTPFTEIGPNDDFAMKQEFYWPTDQYLNIYVARTLLGGGVAGYAYYPYAAGDFYDGIVMLHSQIGSSKANSGTLAHEVGHYLGLPHPFDQGCQNDDCLIQGDRVCDTPPDDAIYFEGCGPANHCQTDADDSSINNPFQSDTTDFNDLYMDYNQAVCRKRFTPGQVERMRVVLRNLRPSLINSHVCRIPIPYDAGITEIMQPGLNLCESPQSIQISLRNFGLAPLQSADIFYQIDNGPVIQTAWNGNINYTETDTLNLSLGQALTPGPHQVKVFTASPNAQSDGYTLNDTLRSDFNFLPWITAPHQVDFENGLPQSWTLDNPSGIGWQLIERGCDPNNGDQTSCMFMNNQFTFAAGLEDGLRSPMFDLRSVQNPVLEFDYAYAFDPIRPSAFNGERFQVLYSTDCGETFSNMPLLNLSDNALATAIIGVDTSDVWIPQCEDWQTISLDLSALQGEQVVFQFQYSKFENGLSIYLDNINLQGTALTSLGPAPQNAQLQVFPNPNNGNFHLTGLSLDNETIELAVSDILGKTIYQQSVDTQAKQAFDHIIQLPQISFSSNGQKVPSGGYLW